MTAGNLGVVFGPTLMNFNGPIDPQQEIAESGTKSFCIEYMIDNVELFFPDVPVSLKTLSMDQIEDVKFVGLGHFDVVGNELQEMGV